MANEPIRDNTTAQERQTEVLQEATRGQEHLTEAAKSLEQAIENEAKHRQELQLRQQSAPLPPRPERLAPPYQAPKGPPRPEQPPQPPPTPQPALPTPTPPRPAAPLARWLTEAEAQKMAAANPPAPKPPPIPPHVAMLHNAVGSSLQRTQELADFYRQNPKLGPQSLAAQGMRQAATAQDDFIGKQFAALSPAEQKQAAPLMQALEAKRNEVLERENQLREKLNKELAGGTKTLQGFLQGLASGRPGAALGSLLSPGGIAGTLATLLGKELLQSIRHEDQRQQAEIVRGGNAIAPSLADTQKVSEELAAAAEALRVGETQKKQSESQYNQLLNQARSMQGWGRTQDPNSWLAQGEAFRTWFRSQAAYERAILNPQTGTRQRGEAARMDTLSDYLRNWIERHGGTPRPFLQNFQLPVQGGITNALQYQSELQVNALQRNDASNELLQQQLRYLMGIERLLTNIQGNTNGLENQGWGTP